MGMQGREPGMRRVEFNEPLADARVLQWHAELGGGRGRAHGGDAARPGLRIEAKADARPGAMSGDCGDDPLEFLKIIDIQVDALFYRLADHGGGLGGFVKHHGARRETGPQGLGNLALAGDLGAHAALTQQGEHAAHAVGLDREAVLKVRREALP